MIFMTRFQFLIQTRRIFKVMFRQKTNAFSLNQGSRDSLRILTAIFVRVLQISHIKLCQFIANYKEVIKSSFLCS
ncbi:hypothetical protein VIBNISO65_1550044 [Vibrio nigripulchritudo SO65]|nr:hypothetical protein VIBNIAM115_470015 [Vibrio nigripulchritudo AM115]CCN41127.1 hypothetical protein VIBNIFTn2_1480014 [Vibrio nigripulchritudo FTn2]CCN67602.1 hypothetical protein VIBNIPon4_820044 [Vibrio nigripulchritudo POn4]CCN76307.1 hypothetical protein VIBNISO65_1550044 [Vibrio nigripulchritudo SO65]